jgi:hypothetical protein
MGHHKDNNRVVLIFLDESPGSQIGRYHPEKVRVRPDKKVDDLSEVSISEGLKKPLRRPAGNMMHT